MASYDELRLILGHAEGGEEAHLFLTEFPPKAAGVSDRYHARLQVIRLYDQGWAKVSIRRVLQVSRPTVSAWIRRFEAEYLAGLVDNKRGPKNLRKVWPPHMVPVHHVERAHPDAGEFHFWSRLT